ERDDCPYPVCGEQTRNLAQSVHVCPGECFGGVEVDYGLADGLTYGRIRCAFPAATIIFLPAESGGPQVLAGERVGGAALSHMGIGEGLCAGGGGCVRDHAPAPVRYRADAMVRSISRSSSPASNADARRSSHTASGAFSSAARQAAQNNML